MQYVRLGANAGVVHIGTTRIRGRCEFVVPVEAAAHVRLAAAMRLSADQRICFVLYLGKTHPDVPALFSGPLECPWRAVRLVIGDGQFIKGSVVVADSIDMAFDELPADPRAIAAEYREQLLPEASILLPDVDACAVRTAVQATVPDWNVCSFYETGYVAYGPLRRRRAVVAILRLRFPDVARTMRLSRPEHCFHGDKEVLCHAANARWPAVSAVILALMLAVALPPYVALEIVDWLPEVHHHGHLQKIRFIEQIQASIRRAKSK